MVYGGATTSCPKIGEYGGNAYGYGGRSVVKTGWPKEIVKVCEGVTPQSSGHLPFYLSTYIH